MLINLMRENLVSSTIDMKQNDKPNLNWKMLMGFFITTYN